MHPAPHVPRSTLRVGVPELGRAAGAGLTPGFCLLWLEPPQPGVPSLNGRMCDGVMGLQDLKGTSFQPAAPKHSLYKSEMSLL